MAKTVAFGVAITAFVALLMAPKVCCEKEERILNDHSTKTLTIYYQDITGGPFINLVPVAGAPGRPRNLITFGTFYVTNPPARLGISLSSPQIGEAQGVEVVTSFNGDQLFVSYSLVFTNGEYSGSTMEFQGIFSRVNAEVALLSGTKHFRGVKGYASLETVQEIPASNSTIVKSVIVYKHYDD